MSHREVSPLSLLASKLLAGMSLQGLSDTNPHWWMQDLVCVLAHGGAGYTPWNGTVLAAGLSWGSQTPRLPPGQTRCKRDREVAS